MDIHFLTPQGDQLVVQVVGGQVVVPPAVVPQAVPAPNSLRDLLGLGRRLNDLAGGLP